MATGLFDLVCSCRKFLQAGHRIEFPPEQRTLGFSVEPKSQLQLSNQESGTVRKEGRQEASKTTIKVPFLSSRRSRLTAFLRGRSSFSCLFPSASLSNSIQARTQGRGILMINRQGPGLTARRGGGEDRVPARQMGRGSELPVSPEPRSPACVPQ